MTPRVLALAAVALGGCGFQFGSAYVGQWRARDVADHDVCVEDASGRCGETSRVMAHLPARRYWGFDFTPIAMGASLVGRGDDTASRLRMETSIEYLRGHGGLGFGLRLSGLFDAGGKSAVMASVLPVVHFGLSDRASVYGGLGYLPFTMVEVDTDDQGEVHGFVGGRALAGLQTVLFATPAETRLIFATELDGLVAAIPGDDYRSFGLTFKLSLSL